MLLGKADNLTSVVREMESYAALVAQGDRETGVGLQLLVLPQLQGLATAYDFVPEAGSHGPQFMAAKELPMIEGVLVRIVLLLLASGKTTTLGLSSQTDRTTESTSLSRRRLEPFL